MKFTQDDFVHDFITKRLAATTAQDKFDKWAKDFNVCTHPPEKIRLPKSGYEFITCEFQCECGAKLKVEITGTAP